MPMNKPPLVSVIMAAYNMERFIGDAVQSILDQSYRDWELLVVDDGSTDGTGKVVQAFTDPRIHYYWQENAGRSRARNRAIRLAEGKYLAPMDADDLSPSSRLAEEAAFLESHPDVAVVSGRVLSFWQGRPLSEVQQFPETPDAIRRRFEAGMMAACHGGSMLRRQALAEVGLYCEDCRTAEDLDLFLRISERHRFAWLPSVVLHYRNEPTRMSFADWTRLHLYHEYAVHRRDCLRGGVDAPAFARFVKRPAAWARVLGWHGLRFGKMKLAGWRSGRTGRARHAETPVACAAGVAEVGDRARGG
jgi:glycosyltransferase involved in cell wall biosynthesis